MSTRHLGPTQSAHRARRTGPALVALAVAAGLTFSGAVVWRSTEAAFTGTTGNEANSWATGTVLLADDATGVAFQVGDLQPGQTGERCIVVTYQGTVTPADVRVYAADFVEGGLGDHLTLTVREGTGGSFGGCAGFTSGSAVPLSESVSAFAARTGFASGWGTWTPATNGATRTYQISYTVGPDAPQSSSATLSFVWEAQA